MTMDENQAKLDKLKKIVELLDEGEKYAKSDDVVKVFTALITVVKQSLANTARGLAEDTDALEQEVRSIVSEVKQQDSQRSKDKEELNRKIQDIKLRKGDRGERGEKGDKGDNGKDIDPKIAKDLQKRIKELEDGGPSAELLKRVEDLSRNVQAAANAVPITTTFFYKNGTQIGRAKNINIIEGANTSAEVSIQGDQVNITLTSSGSGGGGIASINADSTSAQVLAIGTSGTDFAIADNGTGTHTFNLPTASATNRGALSSADWTTFNNKGNGTVTSVSGTTNRITSTGGATPAIDISASYVGQSSITTLGTITTGVWSGTTVALNKGGTGLTSISALSIWAANSANTLVEITPSAGQSIRINAGGTAWEAYTPGSGGTPGGADTQVQFNDSGAFGGDSGFTYNKTSNVVSMNGVGSGQIGSLNITRGDSVNQYIVLTESASSTGSAYLTFAGSNPGAMAMGALYTAGVPTSYVFTNTGGTPILSIAESTGLVNIPSLTASEIVITDASKNLISAAVATYPSLTELTYLKGVTSAIQTQLNAKGAGTVTSVGFTGGIISVATATTTPAFTVAGTSGGIPYFNSASTWATSAALAANALVVGGGAGVAPSTVTTGTGVITALGVNTGSAGAVVLFNGALGTPSSGTVTNLTGTASININGTVGATTPTTGVFTTLVAGSTTSLLLGTAGSAVGNIGFRNATSGTITLAPVTGALGTVTLTLPARTDTLVTLAGTEALSNKTLSGAAIAGALTGTGAYIPVTLLNSGTSASSSTFWRGDGTWASPSGAAFIGVRVTASAGESIGTTLTALSFDTESYDTDSMHAGGSPTRITFTTAGYYQVDGVVATDGNAITRVQARLNGSTIIYANAAGNAGASTQNGCGMSFAYNFAANDYIEMLGAFGTTQTTTSGVGGCFISASRLG